MNLVETANLSKTYRSGVFKKKNIKALSNVSLSVESGEIFGLLGPNGAGKTTFVKILLSIVHPTSGSATVFGQPLGALTTRQKIGYLPENHRYPSFLTAWGTVVHFGRLHGIPEAELKSRATRLLKMVGLEDWFNVKIKKFSKGMLQRLGLAQAMINDPEILFLDEPTDGVDPVGRKEIRDILKSLRTEGKTIFLNSHMLSEVEEVSDRVAILNKGEVLRVGTIADLTTPRLEYDVQLTAPPPEVLLQDLRSVCNLVSPQGSSLLLGIKSKDDLNRVIELFRNHHCSFEALTPRKAKLEDYFIDLIKGTTPS